MLKDMIKVKDNGFYRTDLLKNSFFFRNIKNYEMILRVINIILFSNDNKNRKEVSIHIYKFNLILILLLDLLRGW